MRVWFNLFHTLTKRRIRKTDSYSVLSLGKVYLPWGTILLRMSDNLYAAVSERTLLKPEPAEGRRSLLQIRIDILRVIMQGYGKPTQVMYQANLSWKVLQTQLSSFLEAGLLRVEAYGTRRKYAITPKGAEMVRSFQKVADEVLK